jgi:hypothetical protein
MKTTTDWDDHKLSEIGRHYAAQAYTIADDLEGYGADAAALLEPVDLTRPHHISIPTMLALYGFEGPLLTHPRLRPKSTFPRFTLVRTADLEGQQRAESAPTRVASGRAGVHAKAALP